MERKNMVLLTVIAVATLLVAVVGATFAYFTATVQDNRTDGDGQGETSIKTDKVASTTTVANISDEAGKFTAEDVYPGHKEIAAVQVTVTGEEGDVSRIAFKYNVTKNDLGNDANITVYGLDTQLNIGKNGNWFQCEKKTKTKQDDENTTLYYEECQDKSEELPVLKKLTGGTEIIPSSPQDIIIGSDAITIDSSKTKTKYYYIVIEYENNESEDDDQNEAMGKELSGSISVIGA